MHAAQSKPLRVALCVIYHQLDHHTYDVVWCIKVAVLDIAPSAQLICGLIEVAFCKKIPFFYIFCNGAALLLTLILLKGSVLITWFPPGLKRDIVDGAMFDNDAARHSSHELVLRDSSGFAVFVHGDISQGDLLLNGIAATIAVSLVGS